MGIWLNENPHKMWWVIMKSKCDNVNECGDNMIWGYWKRLEQYQMSLSKCYQNVLTYKSIKLM